MSICGLLSVSVEGFWATFGGGGGLWGGCALSVGGVGVGSGRGVGCGSVGAVSSVDWAVWGHALEMTRRNGWSWWLESLLVELGLCPGAVEVPCRCCMAAGGRSGLEAMSEGCSA